MNVVLSLCVAMATGADLDGTEIDQHTLHTGAFGQVIGGTYQYGTVETFNDPTFPQFTYDVISPAGVPGFENSVEYDLTNFSYDDFAHQKGTVLMEQIEEEVEIDSLVIFAGDGKTEIGFDYVTDPKGMLEGSWNVDDVLAVGDASIFVCWNSVTPCPGDCNGDEMASVLDFVCFQIAWIGQDEVGDCNGDGEFTIIDYVCFELEWKKVAKNGCPK